MSSERTVDYAEVLADLEAQRTKLDAAIEAIRALQQGGAIPVGPAATSVASATNGEAVIALDTFHRMSVPQAIKKYLSMRGRRPATTVEIAAALTAGGQAGSDGANFNVVVNNTLNRMQASDGGISKVKRGVWGLSEWYETKPE